MYFGLGLAEEGRQVFFLYSGRPTVAGEGRLHSIQLSSAMEQPPSADILTHVRWGISVIFGLGLTHLFRGIVEIIRRPGKKPLYPTHLVWIAFTFLLATHFWWWQVNIDIISHWNVLRYLFLICYAGLIYFLCILIIPGQLDQEHEDYRAYFAAEQRWIFGVLALIYLVDVYDTSLKGAEYFRALGPEYLIRAGGMVALSLLAMFVRNGRFHAAFGWTALVYQASWMLRTYTY